MKLQENGIYSIRIIIPFSNCYFINLFVISKNIVATKILVIGYYF